MKVEEDKRKDLFFNSSDTLNHDLHLGESSYFMQFKERIVISRVLTVLAISGSCINLVR
jgi:hypothetical protein